MRSSDILPRVWSIMGEQEQQEIQIQRAPSTICLLCASCRRRVTPCLVCAHLLPCCSCCSLSLPWLACPKCKVKNPLGDQERRLLGFPPASALPTSMVRRALIAHIGRPSCTAAMHFQYKQLQQELVVRQEEAVLGSQGAVNSKDSFTQFQSCNGEVDHLKLLRIGLPFIQCEGIVTNVSLPLQKQISDADEGSRHTQILLGAEKDVGLSCKGCSGNCKLACLNGFMVDNNDAALRRCQEQLVALHCAEALSADLKCPAYPVCNTISRSSLWKAKIGRECSLGMGRGISIGMLRMVNSVFFEDFEIWLTDKCTGSQERCKLDNIFSSLEAFTVKQDQLLDLQRSMLQAVAAHKQVSIDSRAEMPRQSLYSMVSMLEQIFADRGNERMDKATRAAEPFLALLHQMNLVLEFLYSRTHDVAVRPDSFALCTDFKSVSQCNDMFSSIRHLQTAVSYWLLLYHDVAHATLVI